jgi:hypothetical protein
MIEKIYAARDTSIGKLVSDITNPGRKFWERRAAAVKAIENYNECRTYYGRRGNHGVLELVTFNLIEATE